MFVLCSTANGTGNRKEKNANGPFLPFWHCINLHINFLRYLVTSLLKNLTKKNNIVFKIYKKGKKPLPV